MVFLAENEVLTTSEISQICESERLRVFKRLIERKARLKCLPTFEVGKSNKVFVEKVLYFV